MAATAAAVGSRVDERETGIVRHRGGATGRGTHARHVDGVIDTDIVEDEGKTKRLVFKQGASQAEGEQGRE